MLTPAEWNQQSLFVRQMAEDESDPHLKRRLEQHALALAEHARKVEREATARKHREVILRLDPWRSKSVAAGR